MDKLKKTEKRKERRKQYQNNLHDRFSRRSLNPSSQLRGRRKTAFARYR